MKKFTSKAVLKWLHAQLDIPLETTIFGTHTMRAPTHNGDGIMSSRIEISTVTDIERAFKSSTLFKAASITRHDPYKSLTKTRVSWTGKNLLLGKKL